MLNATAPWRRLLRFFLGVSSGFALVGPWIYERVNVPAQYACAAPNIRIEGDYCGVPLSALALLALALAVLPAIANQVVSGVPPALDPVPAASLFTITALILAAPIVSVLWAALDRGRRRWPIALIGLWGVVFAVTLTLGILPYARPIWEAWGVWLSAGVAAIGIAVEGLLLASSRVRRPA